MSTKQLRQYWFRRWRMLRARNLAAGLTVKGGERKRAARLTREQRMAYNLAKHHRAADRFAERGLTTRGTVRKLKLNVERARLTPQGRLRLAAWNCESAKAAATMRALTLVERTT